ncbi:MAG: metal ABC transporter ATP-binding protein [Vicinamibacterales bacterium]
MQGPAITFEAVSLSLAATDILRTVSLSVAPGSIHCIIGPNGGGKTSLIRCLLGQMPHTGRISIAWNGNRTIGYVPQFLDFDKTLPITVSDLMAIVCQRRPVFFGMNRRHRADVEAALERVGLKGKRKSRLGSLSGGERQRVLFAQALIPEPSLLILDEPMTSMDEVGSDIFLRLIRSLAESGTTIVWIAHDLAQVRTTADAVTCLNGTVLFSGSPSEVLLETRPEVLFGHVKELV